MTSARTKPFWMSEWISPAACQAVRPRRRCQDCAGLSSPAVKNAIRSSSVERAADDALQAGLADAEVLAHRRRLVVVELGQLGLDAAGDRDGDGALGGGVRGDRRPGPRRRPRRRWRRTAPAWRSAATRSRAASGASSGDRDGARRAGPPAAPRSPRAATPPRRRRRGRRRGPARTTRSMAALGLLEVGVDQLGLDRLDVARRVDAALGVDDVGVVVRADDVQDRVGLADVGQELVAEALALVRAARRGRRCRGTRSCRGRASRRRSSRRRAPAARRGPARRRRSARSS